MGLNNLTEKEKESILKAMDLEDSEADTTNLYAEYSPTAITVAHILSERAGMQWTTFAQYRNSSSISSCRSRFR